MRGAKCTGTEVRREIRFRTFARLDLAIEVNELLEVGIPAIRSIKLS
jgi:hypothetical protein